MLAPQLLTFGDFWQAWLPRHALTVRPKTLALYRYAFAHFLAALAGLALVDVTREAVLDVLADMARRNLAPNTIQLARAAVSACLRDAHEARLIPQHPLAGLRMRGRAASVRQAYVYTDPEFAAFLACACRTRPELAPLFALCGKVGHRPGEAQATRLEDVDLVHRLIRVERTAHDGGVVGPTKTGKARVVDLPQSVAAMLALHEAGREGWLFPAPQHRGPIAYRRVWRAMRDIADRASVPRTTPHSLRHYAAGAMLQLGLPLLYVSRQLGHAKIAITAETYANHLRLARPGALDGW